MLPLFVIAVAIAALVVLVAWAKMHPFLAFILVSAGAAVALGMPLSAVPAAIRKGMGDMLGSLLVVIVTGAMLGKLVVESGAAQRIADTLVAAFGERRMAWAMALTGFIVGIPLFYGVGFVLLVPIIFAVIGRYRLPLLVVALPALASMSVAHGLLPPHPAPTALVAAFKADMGLTLLYGVVIAVPALVLAGPIFGKTLSRIPARPLAGLEAKPLAEHELPGVATSILTALLPAVLLVATTAVHWLVPAGSPIAAAVGFVSDPDVVMIVALAVATVTLGLARGRSLAGVMQTFGGAINDVASMLLVIGGSGAFKEVLLKSGVNAEIASLLQGLPLDPLVVAWLVTAVIRVCVGSATVAGLTAAGILADVVADGGADPNLMVLAIGAGSLFCSHVNDAAFWLFKEYFNVSLADTLKSWTVMESIVSVVGLVGVLVLSWSVAAAEPPASHPWDISSLSKPPAVEWLDDDDAPVRSLVYTGEPFQERATKVFAYYATPASVGAKPQQAGPWPGIVLVHGGGGTAFAEWVTLWAERGYAAIAMDLAGSRPDPTAEKKNATVRLPDGGPGQDHKDKFDTIATPETDDDWPYHAVANVIRAHSLLRSLPGVDPDRTAITGISWGGYTTCIVASIDDRFRAAVPVYGCGHLRENSCWLGDFERIGPEGAARWEQLYDPGKYLPACRVPIFFINGTNDFAYPLDSYMKSHADVRHASKNVRIEVNMPHGHAEGWAPPEIAAFIDAKVRGTPPLPELRMPLIEDKVARCRVASGGPVESASLVFTAEPGPINKLAWQTVPAEVAADGTLSAPKPPENSRAYFFTATTPAGLQVSSPAVIGGK
jgi:Gnt-I system high-affinity gluconate transporter